MSLKHIREHLENKANELKRLEQLRDWGAKDEEDLERKRELCEEKDKSYENGRQEGRIRGKIEGLENGKKRGRVEGYRDGLQQGRTEGRAHGYEDAKENIADYLEAEMDKRRGSTIKINQDEIKRIRNL